MPKQAGGWTRPVPPIAWVLTYVVTWGLVALLPLGGNDLDQFFWPSARAALAGHPLMVYQPAGQNAYPNANGPLALAPLTGAGAVVQALGWMGNIYLQRLVALTCFSIFALLMAREAVRAVERLRGHPLSGRIRLLALSAFAIAPPIWHAVAGYGHIEQPIEIWLVLLATRWAGELRPLRGGAMLGLGTLARSSALLLSIPVMLASWRHGFRRSVALTAAGAVVWLGGLLPFYIADRSDLVHSLFVYRSELLVGTGSIWTLSRGSAWEAVAKHSDLLIVALVVLALNLWLATRRGGMTGGRVYAALALTSASFALLAKTVWPYYFLEVYVFAAIWALGRVRASKPALLAPLVAVSALGLLAEVGSSPNQLDSVVRLEAAAMFICLGAGMIVLLTIASGSAAAREQGPAAGSRPGWR